MTRPDEIAALADRIERSEGLVIGEGQCDDNGRGGIASWIESSALHDSDVKLIVSALRLSATSPGDAVREALENLEVWCGNEGALLGAVDGYDYRSGQEAAYRHVAIEIKKRLTALTAPAAKAVDAAPTTQPNYESLLKTLRWWRDNSTANSIELTRAEVIVLADGMIDELSYADLRASGGVFPEAYAATPTPPSGDVAKVEKRAKEIYDGFAYEGPGNKPAWVNGGNSSKQNDARALAQAETKYDDGEAPWTEDEQFDEQQNACIARRKKYGQRHCEEKDGSCTECEDDAQAVLRRKYPIHAALAPAEKAVEESFDLQAQQANEVKSFRDAISAPPATPTPPSGDVEKGFQLGDRVQKVKGSSWHGTVCGFYSTSLTPVGYAVESEREPGSVQIYPEAALELIQSAAPGCGTEPKP